MQLMEQDALRWGGGGGEGALYYFNCKQRQVMARTTQVWCISVYKYILVLHGLVPIFKSFSWRVVYHNKTKQLMVQLYLLVELWDIA